MTVLFGSKNHDRYRGVQKGRKYNYTKYLPDENGGLETGDSNPLVKLRYFSFSKYGNPPLNTKPRDASICNGRDPETKEK